MALIDSMTFADLMNLEDRYSISMGRIFGGPLAPEKKIRPGAKVLAEAHRAAALQAPVITKKPARKSAAKKK